MKLNKSSILITGASRGLGRALAIEAARRGARVGLVARSAEALEAVVDEIRAGGGEAHALPADISDAWAIHPLAGRAHMALGPVSILINNASRLGPTPLRSLLDTECEDLAAVFETNLVGPFRLTKQLLGPMITRGQGVVVNISSDAAVEAYPTWGAYGASKAALDHLTRIWAEELRAHGVRLLAVDPGEMNTQMHAEAIPDADPSSLADPADVARGILDLVERAAELLTRVSVDITQEVAS
ncbi:MAG: SDR family NAD(P)-dependent oxidoreductase [Bradymonadia bacterium]